MDGKFLELCHSELEIYLNKYIEGDLTPLVYMLLKDSPNKKALLEYLGRQVKNEEKQETPSVEKPSFSKLLEASLIIEE